MGHYYLDLDYKSTGNNDQKRNLTPVFRYYSVTFEEMFAACAKVRKCVLCFINFIYQYSHRDNIHNRDYEVCPIFCLQFFTNILLSELISKREFRVYGATITEPISFANL